MKMKVESTRLLFIFLIYFIIKLTNADGTSKRQDCRDFAGDLSNCQRFIRCFYNLRVLFTCASGTAYVPELKTCVAKELVNDCDDSKNRVDVTISSNDSINETDDYPTIEADFNSLEVPMQKSLSSNPVISITSRQFGCSSYCYNQGVCVLVGQKITCRCKTGFIGVRCQVAQSLISTREICAEITCENGGTCVTGAFGVEITCICRPGWTGELCDYDDGPIDSTSTTGPVTNTTSASVTNTTTGSNGTLCPSNVCRNGGTCYLAIGGGFTCTCTGNCTGMLCEVCSTTPTTTGCGALNPCQNLGICVYTLVGTQCQCTSGYAGSSCQTSSALALRNQCQPNPCQNGGSCYLNQGNFACSCPTGFGGTCCETNLAVVNPCYANPCQNFGTCQVVAAATFRCICPNGFVGVRCDQRICDPNPCLYGGVCLPYGNSFQCQCPPSYTGTCCELLLVTTAAPNPCSTQPCLNGGTCSATSATAFVCSCTPSYYGRCCEVRNYCQPSPCYNGGTCVATTNGYLCQCTFPNSGSNCELTIATRAPAPACACILCPCPAPVVTATNPCLPNPCQNNGGCAAVQNTAQCYCQPAFTGNYCQYIRKRSLSHAPCANITCLNGGECYVNDNGAQCTCSKPFFGDRCELINRPRTCNPNPCGKNGQCITTKEGHRCICKNNTTGILCEQILMPKNHRWCPLDCRSGASCVYEGSTPKCRVLNFD